MDKSIVIFAIISFTVFGCSFKKDVEKGEIHPEILLESIATRLPGELFYSEEKLIMIDPFGRPNFIKIFDSNNGGLLGTTGVLGQGPLEFITPGGVQFIENEFLVYDPNLRSLGFFDIAKVNGAESEALKEIQKNELFKGMLKLLEIGDSRFVGANYDGSPFTLIDFSTKEKTEFGKFPVSEEVGNSMDVFQGTIKYHKNRKILTYASFNTKYLSLYDLKKSETIPTLLWEKDMVKPKFRIIENQLEWEKDQEKGFSELCFTKDFIVVSFKEGLNLVDNEGRSTDLIPQSLYIFDYEGNLVKNLVSSVPILRLSDNVESNIVFAIGVTPEFCLMKFNIDDV